MTLYCDLLFTQVQQRTEVLDWLFKNIGDRDDMWSVEAAPWQLWSYRFYFRNEEDLTLFILRWV